MNKLTIIGNLTRDPETRTVNTARGATNVTNFYIAANGRNKREATFFRATAWGNAGETIARYASKGSKIMVAGEVSMSCYLNKEGKPTGTLEITVDDFEFESASQRSFEAYPDSQRGFEDISAISRTSEAAQRGFEAYSAGSGTMVSAQAAELPYHVDMETGEILDEDDDADDDLPF